ncbi:hypothetical protein, partial [Bradyrhizobium sp. Ai1a-2]|uniref:phage adaptor protein n=1 Tax=Bradyrhizobium sp. Ai1a-2 TaxID=196490 RepID=UPI0005BCAB94
MSYTFDSWVAAVANAIVEAPADPNFTGILSSAIDYAEQRLYAELDLLNTVTRISGHLTIGSRDFILPSGNGTIIVTNGINLITPASASNTVGTGKRNQLTPVSRDFLDAVGGDQSFTGVPTNYAMITDQAIIVGPQWPDDRYLLEVIGTIRPTPLSSTNQSTYLTQFLP